VAEWFNIIIPGESHFNPDSYRSMMKFPITRPAGAWGLYQMGRVKMVSMITVMYPGSNKLLML